MTSGTNPSHDAWTGCVGSVVAVRWLDIVQKTVCADHKMRPAECETYGYLEDVGHGRLTIIMERSDDDITKQVFPLGCVLAVTRC